MAPAYIGERTKSARHLLGPNMNGFSILLHSMKAKERNKNIRSSNNLFTNFFEKNKIFEKSVSKKVPFLGLAGSNVHIFFEKISK
jgi:hypothetical protein